MKKLKDLLKESYVWERKFGEKLPTLASIQEKKKLQEGKDLDQKIIAKIAKLTDRNNHTEARIVLAKTIGSSARKITNAYESIRTIQDFLGRGNEVMHARAALDKILFQKVKRVYSNYKEIEGAY